LSANGWGQYVISTVAGNSSPGYTGDGGAATSAQLNFPAGIAYAGGKLYIADANNHVVRVIANGTISTLAGTAGSPGFSGDGASATAAKLNNPTGVAVDSSGNVYIADTTNNVVRIVSGGVIKTFAGNYTMPAGDTGDGAVATSGTLDAPTAVAVDSGGNVYITDSVNNLVRKVSGGNLSTVVGFGSTGGTLNHPNGLVVDSSGALYISDTSHRVLKYANGALTTFAGTGDVGL
jgi:sugar lactone lactonase YvrE